MAYSKLVPNCFRKHLNSMGHRIKLTIILEKNVLKKPIPTIIYFYRKHRNYLLIGFLKTSYKKNVLTTKKLKVKNFCKKRFFHFLEKICVILRLNTFKIQSQSTSPCKVSSYKLP